MGLDVICFTAAKITFSFIKKLKGNMPLSYTCVQNTI